MCLQGQTDTSPSANTRVDITSENEAVRPVGWFWMLVAHVRLWCPDRCSERDERLTSRRWTLRWIRTELIDYTWSHMQPPGLMTELHEADLSSESRHELFAPCTRRLICLPFSVCCLFSVLSVAGRGLWLTCLITFTTRSSSSNPKDRLNIPGAA